MEQCKWYSVALLMCCIPSVLDALMEVDVPGTGESCYLQEDDIYGDCYLFASPTNWETALDSCHSYNGTFIPSTDYATLDILRQIMLETRIDAAWLGVSRHVTEWIWDGQDQVLGSYNYWEEERIREIYNSDCVMLVPYSEYVWRKKPCATPMGYICEVDIRDRACQDAPRKYNEVLDLGDRCFMIKNDQVSWFAAKQRCREDGATLIQFDEEGILERLLLSRVGSNDPTIHGYWIGLSRAKWMDTQANEIDDPLWEASQPSRPGNCTTLEKFNADIYLWANQECDQQLHYFCRIDSPLTPEVSSLQPNDTSVPNITLPYTSTTSATTPTQISTTTTVSGHCALTDIVFILDSSDSVTSQQWQTTLHFVKTVLSNFVFNRDCYQLAVISFGAKTVIEVNFSSQPNDVKENILTLPHFGGKRHLSNALVLLDTHINSAASGRRANAHLIAIIITTGPSPTGSEFDIMQANIAKNKGTTVAVLGIGDSNVKTFADQMASPPSTNFAFTLPYHNTLQSLTNIVIELLSRYYRYTVTLPTTTPHTLRDKTVYVSVVSVEQTTFGPSLNETKEEDRTVISTTVAVIASSLTVTGLILGMTAIIGLYVVRRRRAYLKRLSETNSTDSETPLEPVEPTRWRFKKNQTPRKNLPNQNTNISQSHGSDCPSVTLPKRSTSSNITTPWGSVRADRRYRASGRVKLLGKGLTVFENNEVLQNVVLTTNLYYNCWSIPSSKGTE